MFAVSHSNKAFTGLLSETPDFQTVPSSAGPSPSDLASPCLLLANPPLPQMTGSPLTTAAFLRKPLPETSFGSSHV